jgi:glycosyltransferase involved in cell wall biosynthesis|tara:strand:+ start:171 stop:2057 length:1887 start_codon:yes stop_codon:yes gene_type:complete
MSKKTILFHSNFCRAFTGFGKNKKNLLRYLYKTGKYNLVELANGIPWDDPKTKSVPWECRGSLPHSSRMEALNPDEQRMEGYGRSAVDRAVKEFKPDIYIGMEDIWAFSTYHSKPWWSKINTMIWTTLDSLPILPQAVDFAPKVKNYYVWASFAERAMRDLGYDHIKTLRGSLDTSEFFRCSDEDRHKLRASVGLGDEYIVGFVFRNQLRKSVPNLLEGFQLFKKRVPKAKLLLHTHWSEGWNIPQLLEEKGIETSDVLTTYICHKCDTYCVHPFSGQDQNCPHCKAERSVHTTNTGKGVTEEQLNQIYNLMDVYCHPFTSGGQEIPVQEAKLTELITLVTNYSCGEDNCTEESGGIPLKWHEYREPGTQFIKASTDADDIYSRLLQVYEMSDEERREREKKSRQWVIDNFSIEVIGKKVEEILDAMPSVYYDFALKPLQLNPDYLPPQGKGPEELVQDLYKNILYDPVDKNSQGFKHWVKQLKGGLPPEDLINHFKKVATTHNANLSIPSLEDFLDADDEGRRIGVVIPQSESDVFLVNSLMKNLKKQYEDFNIYVFTQPQYYPYIEDNPAVYKCLPHSPLVENAANLEGCGDHKGSFEMVFHPHTTTQKTLSFIHNGINKHQFSLI